MLFDILIPRLPPSKGTREPGEFACSCSDDVGWVLERAKKGVSHPLCRSFGR